MPVFTGQPTTFVRKQMFAVLFLSAGVLLALYLYSSCTYWKRRGVPQETPIPLIGNLKGIGTTHHILDINQRMYRKFKGCTPFAGSYLFVQKTALIFDLDLIKSILIKDFSNFRDRGSFNNVRDDPLTGNVLTLEGEDWRAMRTKLSPIFTSARIKYMFPTAVREGDHFSKVVGNLINHGNGNHLEMKDLCARFTTDVIGSCAFGIECNSLEDPNAEFRRMGDSIFGKPRHYPVVQLFLATNGILAKKLRMKLFPDELTKFFLSVVKQTVEYRGKNNVKRNDFMDLLIDLKAKDENMAKSEQGIDLSHGLTIEQIAAQTFVFFLAGFETSSTTMSFCLYELAHNMTVQEKLHTEIMESLRQSNGELTYEGLNAMVYLEQVIAETLRKYPVLPFVARKVTSDYHVPNTHHVIEADTVVSIPIHAIHHDPEYFDHPDQFDPSRFEASECEKRNPFTYLPFGEGPRNCIGMRFGKMQTKIGLASLLRNYRFECCPLTEEPIELDKKNFLMTPKNGVHLKVTPW